MKEKNPNECRSRSTYVNDQSSVKCVINSSVKPVDTNQSAKSAQADLDRNFQILSVFCTCMEHTTK